MENNYLLKGCLEQRRPELGLQMIILSFNYHRLASTHNKLTLKYLFLNYCPDAIMLQETLGVGTEVENSLSKMMSSWSFMMVDTKGRSKGLALGVKDSSVKLLNS